MFERAGCKLEACKSIAASRDDGQSVGARLERAICRIRTELGPSCVFFVEETSLHIASLGTLGDCPGAAVEDWLERTTFERLDELLLSSGNDRRATIRSDIALHLPAMDDPIFFCGETEGRIASAPPRFALNAAYPWLSPDTLNGWFVPYGETRCLGEMEPERSLEFDFRARALDALLDRLYEYNAVANVGSSGFRSRPRRSSAERKPPILVVIGHRCAGKTAFGDFACREFGAVHIEASSVIRQIAKRAGERAETSKEATEFLQRHGFDVVAREIVNLVEQDSEHPTVITGIRTVEELLYLARTLTELEIVHVQADPKTRFARHLRRARDREAQTMSDFSAIDEEQSAFGLLRVAEIVADFVLRNDDASLGAYLETAGEIFHTSATRQRRIPPLPGARPKLDRALAASKTGDRAPVCEEIGVDASAVSVRRHAANESSRAEMELSKYGLGVHEGPFLDLLRARGLAR